MRRVLGLAVWVAPMALAIGAATAAPSAAQAAPSPTPAPAPEPAPGPADGTTVAPTTTIPQGCTAALPVALQFVGTAEHGTDTGVVRFAVTELRNGTVPGTEVDIDYSANDDRRFLGDGHSYLVTAAVDPESSRLVSKVRQPREEPAACAPFDPVYTRHADGSEIDTSLLAGMRGKWGDAAMSFLIPTAAVFAVLLGLVILKRTLVFTGRGMGWGWRRARDRRLSKQSHPASRRPPAGGPPPASRTRTHTGTPAAR
jgi:hypothetical protein